MASLGCGGVLAVARCGARRVKAGWQRIAPALGHLLYGMTVHEMVHSLERERAQYERLFAALTFGALLGLPLPSRYHGLRLLPFALPRLAGWRRGLWRERDLTELGEEGLS